MKKLALGIFVAAVFMLIAANAWAAELTDLVGAWSWEGFTIEVSECGSSVCATVADGPSHVGEDMFLSEPEASGDGWNVDVMHPATGETYHSHFTIDGDTWTMNGCTDSGVCAEGDFIRQ